MYKYDLAILAIFKNEQSFLPEWLDHYFNRNVDHIYLLNDHSKDSSVDIINSHPNKNNITLKHTDLYDLQDREMGRQHRLYNKYFSSCLDDAYWLGVFDLDEFCYSPHETDFKKILFKYNPTDIHELIIDWYWFGSNNQKEQPESIIKTFNKRSIHAAKKVAQDLGIWHLGYDLEWCCKSFAKTEGIKYIRHHYNHYFYEGKVHSGSKNRPFSLNLSDEGMMFINHYLGAENYYMNNKVKRGSCNNNQTILANKKTLYNFINLNEIEDNRLIQQNKSLSK